MEREEEIDSCTFLELQSGDNEAYSPVVKVYLLSVSIDNDNTYYQ